MYVRSSFSEDLAWDVDEVPSTALLVVRQIDHVVEAIPRIRGQVPVELNLVREVGPRGETHDARLFVEGEVGDVDVAGALVDRTRDPHDEPVVEDQHVCLEGHLEFAIRTAIKIKQKSVTVQPG